MIFVFGSNRSGNHAGGAAKYALLNYGAEMGKGEGHFGTSYAIPTLGYDFATLLLDEVSEYIDNFLQYADYNEDMKFQVTRIGCGIAGFTDSEIAPLFLDAPSNCYFDEGWRIYLPTKSFWGRF